MPTSWTKKTRNDANKRVATVTVANRRWGRDGYITQIKVWVCGKEVLKNV